MQQKLLCLLSLTIVLACRSDKVGPDDARALLKALESVATVPDEGRRFRLALAACGEIASCAAGCTRELTSAPTLDDAQIGPVLSGCFDDLAKQHQATRISARTWFGRYLRGYASRARGQLESAEQARLDAAVAAAGS